VAELAPELVVLPAAGRWILYNVAARSSLGVETSGLELLGGIASFPESELVLRHGQDPFRVWEIAWFANEDGLMADPTPFRRTPAEWPDAEEVTGVALLERFRKHRLVIDDSDAYRRSLGPKTSVLDFEHLGNFHQRLGQHLMLMRRLSPESWWLTQKFTDDLTEVKGNLYGAVQAAFLKEYLPKKFGPGMRVIDLGCGPGYFTDLIARTGADTLGLDPNVAYLDVARHRSGGARFEEADIGRPGALDRFPAGQADAVFMSDAMLFYFVPISPRQSTDIRALFADIRRLLKPGGLFISMEPHYLFWLLPWLGDPEHPFTILSEYRQKYFAVTTSLSNYIKSFVNNGFSIIGMEELEPSPALKERDLRAWGFAREFPLWHVVEARKEA